MSNLAFRQYLELRKTAVTTFEYQGISRSVRAAPAEVFDAWIRQYVEEINDVDVSWDIFDRWDIINAVLKEGFLELHDEENGTLILVSGTKAEIKSSATEEKSSVDDQTEDLTSKIVELLTSGSKEFGSE